MSDIAYTHIYLSGSRLSRMSLGETATALVAEEDSLIAKEDWLVLCAAAGGEEALMAEMGITEEDDNGAFTA